MPVQAEAGEYFQTVSTYIHLNPARAKLIRIGEDKLWEYPWSSYPDYVRRPKPQWLVTERVIGSLNLRPQERRGYEAYMEGRVLELGVRERRKDLEASWQDLRRGWYVGGKAFREKLLDKAEATLRRTRPESHARAGRKDHDRSRAEEMLKVGLNLLKVRRSILATWPKGRQEKQVLAWWVYGNTSVTRRWLAEQLAMGYETRVSQAAALVESARDPTLLLMKQKLLKYRL